MKSIYLLSIFLSVSLLTYSQDKSDTLLIRLNKIQKEFRVTKSKSMSEIFLNKSERTLDVGEFRIPLLSYYALYNYDQKEGHTIMFHCSEGDCMIGPVDDKGYMYSGVTFFFKTKKAAYDFMNLVSDLKDFIKSK